MLAANANAIYICYYLVARSYFGFLVTLLALVALNTYLSMSAPSLLQYIRCIQ